MIADKTFGFTFTHVSGAPETLVSYFKLFGRSPDGRTVLYGRNAGIHWPSVGVYHLEFENDNQEVASHCSHNPFEETVAISKRTPIYKEFTLGVTCSDMDVYLEAPDTVPNCSGF